MCPLYVELNNSNSIDVELCVSGQHREMLDSVLSIFNVVPDYDLNVMKVSQSLESLTSEILTKTGKIIKKSNPDLTIVHGDTTTALAASLASFYSRTSIAHVEAGLRTNNLYSPWPEEANRRIISSLSKYNFAPTENAKQNLLKENITSSSIYVTGNTVIDALKMASQMIFNSSKALKKYNDKYGFINNYNRLILVTGHRRENFGIGFENICTAIDKLAEDEENCIVYPVHLNPEVRKVVFEKLKNQKNIYLIDPVDYLDFIYLLNKSFLVLTDSGGIQEEAPSIGKPVLLMRNTTERPEAIEAGTVRLVGTESISIVNETRKLIENEKDYRKMIKNISPYGNGDSSKKIHNILKLNL